MSTLAEYSPDTPQGSRSHDLNLSKLWLCRELNRLDLNRFDTVYILGSWYGSMGIFLVTQHIEFDHCYCIDWNREKTEYTAHYLKRMHLGNRITAIRADANDVQYQGERILVINTSTNDIEGFDWFTNIPGGTIVAFQGRDHQADSNGIETLEKFNRVYSLSETLLLDHLVLTGVDDDIYTRFMKIGIK